MVKETVLSKHVTKEMEGKYLELPFHMEKNVERLDICYEYLRTRQSDLDGVMKEEEINVIDFALCDEQGRSIGASGSNRNHLWVSGTTACDGFHPAVLKEGEWKIVVGAYQVDEQGVDVTYTIRCTMKERRLFKGETHVHTLCSDGFMPVEETINMAARMGLDFIMLTDHNTTAQNNSIRPHDGITVIPGMEWTHYMGHAGMLGVHKPLKKYMHTNDLDETIILFQDARDCGATVVIYHPFCSLCPWKWGFEGIHYDVMEIWNGIMSERNMKAIGWWHMQLVAGLKISAMGGSDFHRPGLLGSMGAPCMQVYAMSREHKDILHAIRNGHGFISYLPDGPGIDVNGLGETLKRGTVLKIRVFNLRSQDVIRLITDKDEEEIVCGNNVREMTFEKKRNDALFYRFEVTRCYEKGLPPMLAMVSNPVYFEQD